MGKGRERPKVGESTVLWNLPSSDACLFLKDVIHICIINIYIYNMNKDIYLFFLPVVPTVGLETELEEVE